MLRVSLLGNLGADPETRYTSKGTTLVTFRVAVNQVRNGPDGERQENTEWFRVRVMGRQADYVQRLGKGARVFVAGRLDIGHFQTREGETRTSFDVWADEVQSLTPRPATADGQADGLLEPEAEAQEAAPPGVSSLAGSGARAGAAPAGAARSSNGTRVRPSRSQPALADDGPPEELEDLPF
jgi:single-strand DNA-binding protein